MKDYLVQWAINTSATSPKEAALYARGRILDPLSTATVWEVTDDEDGENEYIDLEFEPRPDTELREAAAALMAHLWDADGEVYDRVREALDALRT